MGVPVRNVGNVRAVLGVYRPLAYPSKRRRTRTHLKIPESRRLLCLPVSTPSRRIIRVTRCYDETTVWRASLFLYARAPLNLETQTGGGSKINPTRSIFAYHRRRRRTHANVAVVRLLLKRRYCTRVPPRISARRPGKRGRRRLPETSFEGREYCTYEYNMNGPFRD